MKPAANSMEKQASILFVLVVFLSTVSLILIFINLAFNSTPDISLNSLPITRRSSSSLVQEFLTKSVRPFYLGALILNRVFKEDKFHITDYECKQWIEYMLYAGVDHIYWYDSAIDESESQEINFKKYVEAGVMTYHRFYNVFPVVEGSDYWYQQDNANRHFLENYSADSRWVVEMDVDEYPFMPENRKNGFLRGFLRDMEEKTPELRQILVQCMFFLGHPQGDVENGWIIELYQRRKHETEGTMAGFYTRQKPIFRPSFAEGIIPHDPHSFRIKNGFTVVAPADRLRMNHYWGPRMTNFGPDTPELLNRLESDNSMGAIAARLKQISGLHKRGLD